MTRIGLFILALSLTLADGCSSDLTQPPIAAAANTQTVQTDEIHCGAVARERADDALANGYGFDIEASVYQETYDDCLAWRRRDKPRQNVSK